jgi:hypothetical protein
MANHAIDRGHFVLSAGEFPSVLVGFGPIFQPVRGDKAQYIFFAQYLFRWRIFLSPKKFVTFLKSSFCNGRHVRDGIYF